MSSFQFEGIGADFKTFFGLATIDGSIKQLAIDCDGKTLFTSADIEAGRMCWALTKSQVFKVKGSGTCVVNMLDMNKVLKLLRSRDMYGAFVKDDEMLISNLSGKDETTVDLLPVETHIDPENRDSSYVSPEAAFGGKRYRAPLHPPKEIGFGIPVPGTPPNPEEVKGPFVQRYAISKGELGEKLKNGGIIGCDRITLATHPDVGNKLHCILQGDKIVNESEIEMINGDTSILTWNQVFDLSLIQKMIQYFADDSEVYIANTDKLAPNGHNPGLWLGAKVPSSHDEERVTLACYLLSVIDSSA